MRMEADGDVAVLRLEGVLAMQADHRVAADGPFRIGASETQIGLGLPPLVTETFRLRLPAAEWNAVMLEGRLFGDGVRKFGKGYRVASVRALGLSRPTSSQ